MTRAAAVRRGGTTFAVAYLGLALVCQGTGSLLIGSTDAWWPSPLAWALMLGWIPAAAIGIATALACRSRPDEAAPRLVVGVVVAEVLALAALQIVFRPGETPESIRARVAAEARRLAPGDVGGFLERPGATLLERDAALYALTTPDVWRRLAGDGGLVPDDAAAIEAAVLSRLDRAPGEGAAHALLSALAADRLRRASLAQALARWPAHPHDVLTAAAAKPELVLLEGGCLRAPDQAAARAVVAQRAAAEPRAARRWHAWLTWAELRCLRAGRLAPLFAACDAARGADRDWCEGHVLRELARQPVEAAALDDADRSALEDTIAARLADGRLRDVEAERLRRRIARPASLARADGRAP